MNQLNKNKTGLALGLLSIILHTLWTIAIATDLANKLLNWWKSYHFISPEYTLLKFNFLNAVLGLITAFILAYLVGWIFSFIYNKLQGEK